MHPEILMVTPLASAAACAADLERSLTVGVEIADSRQSALRALRRRSYAVMILDEALAESDPDGADALCRRAGLAAPLQLNFAIAGSARVVREVRAAMARREREQSLALRAAAGLLEGQVRSKLTGLLLHAQLALGEPGLPPKLEQKLRVMVELAGGLRQTLQEAGAGGIRSCEVAAAPQAAAP